MAEYVDTNTGPLWETRTGADYPNPSTTFPTSGTGVVIKPLLINYYDDYSFTGSSTLPVQGEVEQSMKVKTMLTGSKVYKDDGTAPLLTVNYYDQRGRLIQSAAQNHIGGTDYVTNTYNFVGELLVSKREHKAKLGTTITILTKNEYDHVGRLLAVKHKINAQDTVLLVKNEYNEIGQLKGKSVGGNPQGTGFHNATIYAYNERGWLKSANSPHFSYSLSYNMPSAAGSEAQYNGNIAEQHWAHKDQTTKTFIYKYDKINRLTDGNSANGGMREELVYDVMGNITKLTRDNHATGTTYSYIGNRLNTLSGEINFLAGYTYDVNGNATKDRTAMNFRYNHLNLPDSAWNNGETVKVGYLYDAMGTKLRKYSNQGGNRDYVGGIEYSGTNIELIHIGEGVAFNNGGVFTYRYNLTDHLGNVRATIQRNPNSGNVEILQQDDYYPFGKQYQRFVSGTENKYLYNGKEKQSELGGGNQYDYGARFYDAEIGRWNVVDPLAEKMRSFSPYNYVFNNPVRFIDPDGRGPELPGLNEIFKILRFNSNIFRAFYGSNNTSNKQLHLWANGKESERNKIKGAVGEGIAATILLGNVRPGFDGLIVSNGVSFGKTAVNGQQIDIQQKMYSGKVTNLFGASYKVTPVVKSYSFDGTASDIKLNATNKFITANIEVKTLSASSEVSYLYDMLSKGVDQTIRNGEGTNTIGILMTDRDAWLKVVDDVFFGEQLNNKYQELIKSGNYLRLEKNLNSNTERAMHSLKGTLLD